MDEKKFEALKTADEYLDNLKSGIIKVINLIGEEEENKACSYIYDIAEGIDWVIQVINLTSDVQIKKIDLFDDMNEKLNQVVEAIENEDYIFMGDVLKYEILPILDEIHKQIKENVLN